MPKEEAGGRCARRVRVVPLIALAAALIAVIPSGALAGWTKGTFQSGGKPVEEYHCTPAGAGAHPAVILLHGLSLPGGGNQTFEQICTDLAAQGYFAEFIEFYSQTGQGTRTTDNRYYPIWLAEIRSGLDALDSNPGVDPKRVAMMGFSLGAFLSLTTGAAIAASSPRSSITTAPCPRRSIPECGICRPR